MKELLKKKVSIALLPTPIEYMANLSDYYGYNIYFKRDDLTGIGISGNKVRSKEQILLSPVEVNNQIMIFFI